MTICLRCKEANIKNPNKLREPLVLNSLSREYNETYICNACGTAESLAERYGVSFVKTRNLLEMGAALGKAGINGY